MDKRDCYLHKAFSVKIALHAEHYPFFKENILSYHIRLEKVARLIIEFDLAGKGLGKLEKPGKILLEDTNLFKALSRVTQDTLSRVTQDKGSMREVFFVSQVKNAGHSVA